MSDDALVTVHTFLDRIEADLAQSALEAAGIESFVRADDCAGLRPHLALSQGVEVVVRTEDLDEARAVIDDLASVTPEELDAQATASAPE